MDVEVAVAVAAVLLDAAVTLYVATAGDDDTCGDAGAFVLVAGGGVVVEAAVAVVVEMPIY
jgi:hypothetical protein